MKSDDGDSQQSLGWPIPYRKEKKTESMVANQVRKSFTYVGSSVSLLDAGSGYSLHMITRIR